MSQRGLVTFLTCDKHTDLIPDYESCEIEKFGRQGVSSRHLMIDGALLVENTARTILGVDGIVN